MQTDWGGEYEKLNGFFQQVGITHHVSCPHAHQQNGSAERKHRHIVEVGLALLANASMPLKFWDEAFLTATFLINLLPSKVLNFETPTERLLHITPNYDALRVFGCACWPNLRPYNKRKLAFRSKQCVFLGYSPLHKGVKCLDVSTGRIYISRDVVFDENVFPFASLHPNAGALLKKELLLLPSSIDSSSLHEGARNFDNHMSPIVPVVHVLHDAEGAAEIGAEISSELEDADLPENDETGTENNAEEHSLTSSDPEDSDSEEDSPATPPSSASPPPGALPAAPERSPPLSLSARGQHTPPASSVSPSGAASTAPSVSSA
jgi:hypothetical protein